MSGIQFKNVSADDPAALVEIREQLQATHELTESGFARATKDVTDRLEKMEADRVQQSGILQEIRRAMTDAPARRDSGYEPDPASIRSLVDGVRPDEDMPKMLGGRQINASHFALITQSREILKAKGADDLTIRELSELGALNDILLIESKRRGLVDPAGFMAAGGIQGMIWFPRWKQLMEKYARALNETNATEGLNWVPTILSGEMWRLVQVDMRLANFFPSFQMTSKVNESVVEGADMIGYYIAEGTADDTSDGTITSSQFTTLKATWTARKYAGRGVTTREIEADSVVNMVTEIQYKIAKALRRAKEKAIVSGQRSAAIDSDTIAASDCRNLWDGIRKKLAVSAITKQDFGAGITAEGLLVLKGQMCPDGRAYGLDPSAMIWLTSAAGYVRLLALKGSSGNAVVLTQDVAGAANTFQRGQLGEMFGSALVVSEFVPQTLDANGLVPAVAGTKTAIYAVNTEAFKLGERLGITLDVNPYLLGNQDKIVYKGVARSDFESQVTPSSTEVLVAGGVNIPTFA